MVRCESAALAALTSLALAACVTTGQSPVTGAITNGCATPRVSVAFTDPDGLPATYDEALSFVVPDGPREGAAVRAVEAGVAGALNDALGGRFQGNADCALSVAVVNVILPDKTRFTPLSGQKSFLVTGVLTGPDGAVLAETAKPFTILAEHQKRGRFGKSAWGRIGNTESLRVEAIGLLVDATGLILADAFAGGRSQTGLAGRLVAYPERAPQ